MEGEEVFIEHILIFSDSESFLIPISKLFYISNQSYLFSIGAKYRNHVTHNESYLCLCYDSFRT